MNNDTPKTDANLLYSGCTWGCGHQFYRQNGEESVFGNDKIVVTADFARELERENTRLREALIIAHEHACPSRAYRTLHEQRIHNLISALPNVMMSDAPSGSTAFTTPPHA